MADIGALEFGGTSLLGNDATHAHSVDVVVVLSAAYILAVNNATHAHTAGNPADANNYVCDSASPIPDIRDDFVDTNGTALSSHISNSGGSWLVGASIPDIYDNAVRFPSAQYGGGYRNINFAEQRIQFQWSPNATNSNLRIWFRRDNSQTEYPFQGYHLLCDVDSNELDLIRVDDQWRQTVSINTTGEPVNFTFEYGLTYNGIITADSNNDIKVYFDSGTADATTLRFDESDSTYSTYTHVGFDGINQRQRLWWLCARNLGEVATGTATGGITRAYGFISAKPIREDVSVDSSSLSALYKIATGDFRIPIGRVYARITNVLVAFTGTTDYSRWTYQVVDKTASGPRVKLFNASGTLADATVDIHIRGY